jgi:hypothetical protein
MGEFTGLIYFAKLDEFSGDLLFLDMDNGFVSPSVSGRYSLAVTLGTNAWQDSRHLDTLSESSQNAQIIFV